MLQDERFSTWVFACSGCTITNAIKLSESTFANSARSLRRTIVNLATCWRTAHEQRSRGDIVERKNNFFNVIKIIIFSKSTETNGFYCKQMDVFLVSTLQLMSFHCLTGAIWFPGKKKTDFFEKIVFNNLIYSMASKLFNFHKFNLNIFIFYN